MGKIPMYQQIERDLRVAILEGKLKQGDMVPSETELAARYKVCLLYTSFLALYYAQGTRLHKLLSQQ